MKQIQTFIKELKLLAKEFNINIELNSDVGENEILLNLMEISIIKNNENESRYEEIFCEFERIIKPLLQGNTFSIISIWESPYISTSRYISNVVKNVTQKPLILSYEQNDNYSDLVKCVITISPNSEKSMIKFINKTNAMNLKLVNTIQKNFKGEIIYDN